MFLLLSLVHCALDYTGAYVVHPFEAPNFSLTTKKGNVVVGKDVESMLRITPDDSDDGVALTLNGSGICIYEDRLEICKKSKRAKFRIKQKRGGYRIKTEMRGTFRKLLIEKCLTMISGKPRLRRCSADNDGQIFLFKKQYNERDEDSELERHRRPIIFRKSFREKDYKREDSSRDDSTDKEERHDRIGNGLKCNLLLTPCANTQSNSNRMRRGLSSCNPPVLPHQCNPIPINATPLIIE